MDCIFLKIPCSGKNQPVGNLLLFLTCKSEEYVEVTSHGTNSWILPKYEGPGCGMLAVNLQATAPECGELWFPRKRKNLPAKGWAWPTLSSPWSMWGQQATYVINVEWNRYQWACTRHGLCKYLTLVNSSKLVQQSIYWRKFTIIFLPHDFVALYAPTTLSPKGKRWKNINNESIYETRGKNTPKKVKKVKSSFFFGQLGNHHCFVASVHWNETFRKWSASPYPSTLMIRKGPLHPSCNLAPSI